MSFELTHASTERLGNVTKATSRSPSPSEEAVTAIIQLLRNRIAEIQVRRPEYSMRAFSKSLGLTATQFSEIINGKRKITRKIGGRILDRLDIDPEEIRALLEKLPAKQTRAKRDKAKLKNQLKLSPKPKASKPVVNYIQLSTDEFRVVADWHYLAILSLVETKGFHSVPGWIAKRLGIRERDARAAVDGLIRLGLLEREAKGGLCTTGKQFTTTNDIPDSSIRKNHAQGLDQAKEALDQVNVELREISASIIAIDPKLLPEAKARLRDLKREISDLLESGEKKEIYRLGIQLFPLTREIK